MQEKSLVIGASGQIGIELVMSLREQRGVENVVASDIRMPDDEAASEGIFEIMNVLNKENLQSVIERHGITEVYLLAALLSATAEKFPTQAWTLNMDGLFNVLELAREKKTLKVFWPSSIAAFGPSTPKNATPQLTIMEPNSVYGISKLAGERWCEYYHQKYDVDVRSLRYPGLIGFRSAPGGGTTDYAVEIFYHALTDRQYPCFLSADTQLPMMMMEDAIHATLSIMQAPRKNIRIRSSYNIAGLSFTPEELAAEIQKHIPGFGITYTPDFRQALADSWPDSISDEAARSDWGWQPTYNTLDRLVATMLYEIQKKKMSHCETE